MGSHIGPLLANAFMYSIEETLEREGKMPTHYKRRHTDHYAKQSMSWQFPRHFKKRVIPLLSSPWRRRVMACFLFWAPSCSANTHVETKVYVKLTNTGLLLHYKSHVDDRYLQTRVTKNYAWSCISTFIYRRYFSEECDRLKLAFSRLKYPDNLVDSTISRFVAAKASAINLFPRLLSVIDRTPFVLSYRLKIRRQLKLLVPNLKIEVKRSRRPYNLYLLARRLDDFQNGGKFWEFR